MKWIQCAAAVSLLALSPSSVTAQSKGAAPQAVTATVWADVQPQIQAAIQTFVNKQKRYPGQDTKIVARVSYEPSTRLVIVDLGRGFIPKDMTKWKEAFSPTYNQVSQYGHDLVDNIFNVSTVSLRFDGLTINEIFPDDFPLQVAKVESPTPPTPPTLLLNPGGGIYYNLKSKKWVAQQGTANEIDEDGMTAVMASLTENKIKSYYPYLPYKPYFSNIIFSRELGNYWIETPSNFPHERLGTRYYTKKLYPDKGATLWNIFPQGTDDTARSHLREWDEDYAARALYANLLNADYLITYHTNGASAVKKGIEVVVQTGSPGAQQLGNSILCYAKEQIHADPAYSDFKIAGSVTELDKIENRLSTMPAVSIGIGYTTDAGDAKALKDQFFREAFARAIEKGLRLRAEPCSPFTLVSVENIVSAPGQGVLHPKLTYSGEFDEWLHIETTFISCPTNDCKVKKLAEVHNRDITDKTKELTFYCPGSLKSPLTYIAKTKIFDRYNVQGGEVQHQYTCTK
ncbi:N-acetylmuramoyl-L-alanine amidase [Xanthomonas nasturtii]|uniref:N-acetylmuramoyl-L-alanine amidase n=3 Tax=Xanthomonas nasturtii TaxID=1843581 RepID=A0ABT0LP11_9XANT|nr:N-acetylmuramoyl-L-alanine amidase [Xanthomonas nasturtii]MCL1550782.1 N-acetylmuramoyl-L-alanine amidase [Xanthomonas nasturtii]MCL1554907.1 N-acetylmuramoyl-L-alanine amidase [Xanthomonas nasturtii]MCL1560072.1 N-acetylmuramoyl-L-alanine amidase [Xanthomonas nasturtii]MCL1571252.1 N-acetylmuramoyl-L-alanine amidase [Xanthomonas nasturtii]MCL1575132.1 N-acetylmuramoyl-L-alanine amidase [Xanthomonas nasturtii]